MLHSCLLPITLCFTGTYWCFYGFSDTNILTRCHHASFCFLLFLIPEKLKNKYSRIGKRSYFTKFHTRRVHEPEGGTREGPGGPTPSPGATPLWPRLGKVWPTWPTSGSAVSPI